MLSNKSTFGFLGSSLFACAFVSMLVVLSVLIVYLLNSILVSLSLSPSLFARLLRPFVSFGLWTFLIAICFDFCSCPSVVVAFARLSLPCIAVRLIACRQ